VLARWDGRRRYANLRKLARLARSYEELRGPDVEGFVRFVRDQEAVGARELEAVAEEEGGEAVRLLTIHAAKGLEFKVVVVADAGRDKAPPASHEILALSDGRFGFRVADPITSKPRGAYAYDAVQEARKAEDRAERLRLYYVAMTRAIDRLIISGSIDPERTADDTTPIGWVLGRLDAKDEIERADGEPVELERGGARVILRVDRFTTEPDITIEAPAEDGQLALFDEGGVGALPALVPALQPLVEIPKPPVHRVRRLSFSALALFDRCSYRYYAERVVGMRPTDERRAVPGTPGLAATEIGDAVHRLLELVNLEQPLPPDDLVARVRAWYPRVNDDELERIGGFVRSYCDSELAQRVATLPGAQPERPFAFEHDDVLLHGRLDVLQLEGERAVVVDYKTNSLAEGTPEEIVEHDYRLQRLVYALACFRAGAQEVEVVYHFLERSDAVVSTVFHVDRLSELEGELSEAIVRINAGEFRPTPSEFICSGCPALDVICAGPRLHSADYAEHALATVL
jgi:ATP-dependent helicase/nuclease subunit A